MSYYVCLGLTCHLRTTCDLYAPYAQPPRRGNVEYFMPIHTGDSCRHYARRDETEQVRYVSPVVTIAPKNDVST